MLGLLGRLQILTIKQACEAGGGSLLLLWSVDKVHMQQCVDNYTRTWCSNLDTDQYEFGCRVCIPVKSSKVPRDNSD